ncbi:MAG: Inosine-5'-monophosphate dehydrogenase [Phycisphaerae bacterium]|nr:Inosine-5'-monophosphate dehydrogenase [Phycisphaerae bacterium]
MPIVQEILKTKGQEVKACADDTTVLEAAKVMAQNRIGAVVVTSGPKVVGIFTERDVLNRIVALGREPANTLVREVMTSPVACCQLNTKLTECKAVMSSRKLRHLPVVEDGELRGMISMGDITSREVTDQATTIEYLSEYLYGRT